MESAEELGKKERQKDLTMMAAVSKIVVTEEETVGPEWLILRMDESLSVIGKGRSSVWLMRELGQVLMLVSTKKGWQNSAVWSKRVVKVLERLCSHR